MVTVNFIVHCIMCLLWSFLSYCYNVCTYISKTQMWPSFHEHEEMILFFLDKYPARCYEVHLQEYCYQVRRRAERVEIH